MSNLTKQKGKATLPDIKSLIEAGINPKTGNPIRMEQSETYANLKKVLRIMDEQQAVNSIVWKDLPTTIGSQWLERCVYYKGSLVFFKFGEEYYFMPYALDGTIDFYGRFNTVHPVPMTSGKDEDIKESKEKPEKTALVNLLSQKKLKIIYDKNQINDEVKANNENVGVILYDYTNQLSWTLIPRCNLNDVIIALEVEALCLMETSMIIGSGIKGVRVPDADSLRDVKDGASKLKDYAINGIPWIPILGAIEFQELTDGKLTPVSEYFLALQSLDNFRLSTYGLDNGGVFEKQTHILESENEVNQNKNTLVQEDRLQQRKRFAELVNEIFGLNVSVDINEAYVAKLGGETQMPHTYDRATTINKMIGDNNGND